MADASSARQQIVDKIKDSSNILVTVGKNPSVDELSAALGFTMMLNKLKKHATAVVSGDIPPAITFLDPEKTFENTVDSLRDFIIALDKEKADHLRYKVEGDVVKIFITPYRTTIGEDDLDFSQGDYNVELVLALGVKDESHLDTALEAHGRILHDATVVTIDNEGEPSGLGSIDWRDETASSLSEMLVSISEAIKGDKPLLDEQISTALLTGIVAATDRFSNERTTSKVMTMSAQLMAAGANQQLIAAKLEDAHAIGPEQTETNDENDDDNSDGTTNLEEGSPSKVERTKKAEPKKDEAADDGSLAISHEKQGDLDDVAKQTSDENATQAQAKADANLDNAAKDHADEQSQDAAREAEEKLAEELQATVPGSVAPIMGGTLNATTEQAADDAQREIEKDRNHTLLSHDSVNVESPTPAFNAAAQVNQEEPPTVDPFAATVSEPEAQPELPKPVVDAPTPVEPVNATAETLAELDAKTRQPHQDDARADIHTALKNTPSTVGLPPLPDFSTLPPLPPSITPPAPSSMTPVDSTPPPASGAVPADELAQIFSSTAPASAPEPEQASAPVANDPGQFRIPGQS